ncbi:hypothetical protein H2248_008306 [Termitomyces sp. 'cryptogamus']|nr:hypothetical protein H2248_008306 [Termitomyces sp. 'cryptogamus']
MTEFFIDAPIVVIPGTPPEHHPQLPQPELIDDSSQAHQEGWPTSNHTYRDNLRLRISPYQNRTKSSPYLNSPVSPAPHLSSPISPPSSLSLSPGGLAAVLGDFSLVDDQSPQDSYAWNTEQNVLQDTSSLSGGGNIFSDGLDLTISMAHDQANNVYPSSATSDEHLSELFLNFEESSNIADHDISSQADFGSYMSPHSEGVGLFFVPQSPAPPVLTGPDLLPTTSYVNQSTLQRRRTHSYTSKSQSTGSSLMPPDDHDNSKQLRRHSHSHSNSCINLMTSGIGALSSSSLLSPDSITSAESNSQLQRRHSHSSGNQRSMKTAEQSRRRAKSVHNRSPYARPRDIGAADAYPTPKSEDHFIYSNTRTPEQSAPPSPLPSSSPHSQDAQQTTGDMFRRYDSHSGTTYPMLQRETIASDAVLQASAKRRKKAPMYRCSTCGQMLTSKDNLNNHMDAHTGIRRHPCQYCHERFRTRSVLKRHQKSIKCPGHRLNSTVDKKVCHLTV